MSIHGSKARRLGFQRERELVRLFWKKGFACMRAPASGAKVKRTVYPDVVALKNGFTLIFEVKTREKRGTIYIEKEKIEKLLEFARRVKSKAYAFIAVKFLDGSGWRFIPVELLEETRGGRFKVTEEAYNKGLTLKELCGIVDGVASLDKFLSTLEA